MMNAVIPFLRVLGQVATGYWLNDFGNWVAGLTGTADKVRDDTGKFKWWYVVILVLLGFLITAAVIMGARKFLKLKK